MKQVLVIFLVILALAIAFRVLEIRKERVAAENSFHNLQVQKEELKNENQKLEKNINYFSFLENLEKEARAQLNLRQPDEKLIIVVPQGINENPE